VPGRWQWKWLDQTSAVTLNADGTGTNSRGDASTWTCTNRTVVFHWPGSTDTMVFSPDGKKLTGPSVPWGWTVSGTRLGH
jgi:hypothetical protein